MKLFLSKANNLWTENRLLKFVVLVLASVQIFTWYRLEQSAKVQQTIVMPPVAVGERMIFEGSKVDFGYLRMYGKYLAGLAFTYTPATAERQFNELLASATPDSFDHLKTILNRQRKVIERERIVSVFAIQDMSFGGNAIILKGMQQIGKSEPESMEYVIGYRIKNGRFGLTELKNAKDTKNED